MGSADTIRVSGLLLAGGQGSRLGGRDKGLMPWRGRPVAAHLTAHLGELTSEVLISCNRNQSLYRQWADQVICDDHPGFPGPLAGILAGLRGCSGTHLLILPCDMPLIDSELLGRLVGCARSQPDRPCITRAGEQWQPLLVVIPRTLLSALQAAWEAGQRSPLRWLLDQPHSIFELPAGDPRLSNANTPKDWRHDS